MRTAIALALLACFVFAEEGKKEEKKEPKKEAPKKEEAPKYPKAPDFKAKGIDGKEYKLEQFKGKIVVLEWGDHNCPWVKRHYKQGTMQAVQKKYTAKGKDVVWLVIASTAAKHKAYLTPKQIAERDKAVGSKATMTLMDTDGVIGQAYQAKTTPHMFVINKKGELVYSGAIDNLRETKNKDDLKKNKNYVAEVLDALLEGKVSKVQNNQPYG
ncbi:MAG: redoxin domain-containing protein [Planctomycetota bacterium]|jgi:cytochrome oxidase Cu insertion factor (SCO1/SenC/PrrC family)